MAAKISFAFLVSRGHAPQRMVHCRRSHRMGASFEEAEDAFREVAHNPEGRRSLAPIPPKPGSVPTPEYKPSRAPELAFADARDEVKMLEVAIEVLGGDNVHTKGLQAALRSARARTKALLVSEWKHGSCLSNGPRNGFNELKRLSTTL